MNSTASAGGRICWIDNLKALGIFCVLLGHQKIDPKVVQYIFSFHVPLFFFISGYLFEVKKYDRFRYFIERKMRTLIIPYFIFAFTSYLFWLVILRNVSIRGQSLQMSALKPLSGIFYSVQTTEWPIPINVALWFLTCLFIIEVMFWVLNKLVQGKKKISICLVSFGLLGYLDSLYMPIRLPWSFDIALTGIVFYGVGYVFKNEIDLFMGLGVKSLCVFTFLFLILNGVSCFLNGDVKVDMNCNYYNNILLFYLSAFSGILGYTGISKIMIYNRYVSFVGKNTLMILGLSGIPFYVAVAIYYVAHRHFFLDISIAAGVLLSVFQIIMLVPIILGVNKYVPFILGREKGHGGGCTGAAKYGEGSL